MHSKLLTQGLVVVKVIHIATPIIASVFFILASCVKSLWPPQNPDGPKATPTWRARLVNALCIAAVGLAYFAEAISLIARSPSTGNSPRPENSAVYCFSSALVWLATLLWYLDSPRPIAYPAYGFWLIYLAAELTLFSIFRGFGGQPENLNAIWQALRVSLLALLFAAGFGARIPTSNRPRVDEENAPLLNSSEASQSASNGVAYGSCESQSEEISQCKPNVRGKSIGSKSSISSRIDDDETKEWDMLIPFFWPSGKLQLQLIYVAIALCLVAERAVNVMIPLQIGQITNTLSTPSGTVPWKQIVSFAVLRLLDSGSGLPAIRRFMWLPLENYSYEKLSVTAFNQIMTLSCDFHDSKHSGKLWHTVYRGQSVKDVVSSICFRVIPMIVDLVLAVSVLYYIFDAYMALIVAAVALIFVWSSGKIVAKQRETRRKWIKKRSDEFTVLTESTSNWKTVSYFNRVPHEQGRYKTAVDDHLRSRFSYRLWDQMENTTQSFLLTFGLMVACFMATYQVATGKRPIGSFVMLLSYWAELSGPLQLIANGLTEIALDIVDVEDFLYLLRQKPTVTDRPDAKPIVLKKGEIDFSGINYSYDGKREVLRDVNFQARAGHTTALVGQTGGGKSTILKLLFRFYDPTSGAVKIDGQDVSQVTLSSLRENIGVVPQDPTLFHDTIMNNIRYARLDASDDDVIQACKAVALHDKIMSFTDGYDTVVGEFGVKLSGGELQRVAIARAIIKNPQIVVLDEATSSVDSETEAQVQESLRALSEGRTTLVIAHRLSTILNADKIIVVNNGEIVEQGNHAELLRNKGYYYRLCSRQGVIGTTDVKGQRNNDIMHDIDFEDAVVALSESRSGSESHQAQGPLKLGKERFRSSSQQWQQCNGLRAESASRKSTDQVDTIHQRESTPQDVTEYSNPCQGLSLEQYSPGFPQHPVLEESTDPSKKSYAKLSRNQKRRRRKKYLRNKSKENSQSISSIGASGSSEQHYTS
ncbi:hypothetical protein VTO42DRAFT_4758 [Malbranchea cinnamomea]